MSTTTNAAAKGRGAPADRKATTVDRDQRTAELGAATRKAHTQLAIAERAANLGRVSVRQLQKERDRLPAHALEKLDRVLAEASDLDTWAAKMAGVSGDGAMPPHEAIVGYLATQKDFRTFLVRSIEKLAADPSSPIFTARVAEDIAGDRATADATLAKAEEDKVTALAAYRAAAAEEDFHVLGIRRNR